MSKLRSSDELLRGLGLQQKAPSANAFAAAEEAEHQHRINSNAFYQREQRQSSAPQPRGIHPAYRSDSEMAEWRNTELTTFGQFMQPLPDNSPALDLGTTPEHTPNPTQRAWVEERTEQRKHEESGSTDERVPVFRPTPNLAGEEFSRQATTKEVKFANTAAASQPPRSPKRSFFDRFKRRNETRPATPMFTADSTNAANHMPPKAAAVLVDNGKTPKRLGRSPSKTKGFFRRRTSEASDLLTSLSPLKEPAVPLDVPSPRPHTSMGHYGMGSRKNSLVSPSKIPGPKTTADSGSARESARHSRSTSHSTPHLGRSLNMMDGHNQIPPTPPSKDTPPDEKAVRNVVDRQPPMLTFNNNTPTKTSGFVTTDARTSPTKSGSYANRYFPQLATKPSAHSMRASVVPSEMSPTTFEEAKARINGLGLAGMDMPEESNRQSQAHGFYSPSVYSPDLSSSGFGGLPVTVEQDEGSEHGNTPRLPYTSPSGQKKRHSLATTTVDNLTVPQSASMIQLRRQKARQDLPPSTDTSKSNETSATIEIAYPDLAKDPSIANFMRPRAESASPVADVSMFSHMDDINSMLQSTPTAAAEPRSQRDKRKMSSGLFYQGPDSSPMPNHPSAQVSPLHPHIQHSETLPATTYTPPPKARKEKMPNAPVVNNLVNMFNREDSPTDRSWPTKPFYPFDGSASDFVVPPGISPEIPAQKQKTSGNVFENKPYLPMQGSSDIIDAEREDRRQAFDIDPRKSPQNAADNFPKHQRTISEVARMIEEREARKQRDQAMKEEAERRNFSSEQRLNTTSGVPSDISGSFPPMSPSYEEDSGIEMTKKRGNPTTTKRDSNNNKKRISTSFAHDFYGSDTTTTTKSPAGRKVSPADTEASTVVLTPNLPHGTFPRKNGVVTSSALAQSQSARHTRSSNDNLAQQVSPAFSMQPPSASSANEQARDEEVNELKALIKRQEDMMQVMMAQMRQMNTTTQGQGQGHGQSRPPIPPSESPAVDDGSWYNPA